MNRLLVYVVGPANAGKTTFCTALADALGGVHMETSAEIIAQYAQATGYRIKHTEKSDYRPALIMLGNMMCAHDPARLVRLILTRLDRAQNTAPIVIGGIRRQHEFMAALNLGMQEGFVVRTAFVFRPVVNEPDNFEVRNEACDEFVLNGTTIDDLHQKARDFAQKIRLGGAADQLAVVGQ